MYFGDDVNEEEFTLIAKTRGGKGGKAKRDGDQTLCANGAAGTAFFDKNDWLMVWNEAVMTSKHTFLTAKVRNPEKFPSKFMAADNLVVGSGANLNIICNSLNRIVFDSVMMWPYSSMTLDTRGVIDLVFNYNKWFLMHPENTYLDVQNVTGIVTFQNYNLTSENKEREMILLNDVMYSRSLNIDVTSLYLVGKIYDPLESKTR